MSSQRYQKIPTAEIDLEDTPLPEYTRTSSPNQTTSPTYFTGLPTSAPPSFHSSHPLVSKDTYPSPTPVAQPQTADGLVNGVVSGVSVWAPSEIGGEGAGALEEAREDAIVRLMERVDVLEGRLEMGLGASDAKDQLELDEAKEAKDAKARETTMVICFVVWMCVTITWVLVK